jgi:hypothetical protein
MRGTHVRIIVHEPVDSNDRGGRLLMVDLMKTKDSSLLSNVIELRPREEKTSFKPLMQYYSVMVDGVFLDEDGNVMDGGIYGSVTID